MGYLYKDILCSKRKKIAMLIDPDSFSLDSMERLGRLLAVAPPDILLVGGSLVSTSVEDFVLSLKTITQLPIVLFPGNAVQFAPSADGLLLLSLISGRNPEFLIGQQVVAAPAIAASSVEVIPTGYMLIDGGAVTSVQYMSCTQPIPATKSDIAVATAQAGQLLGLGAIYLEAGSGARHHVPFEMISAVAGAIDIPLIVGGGIRDAETAARICQAGADMIVVGSALEKDPSMLVELREAVQKSN